MHILQIIKAGSSFPFETVEIKHVQSPTTVNSPQLVVMVTAASMGRSTGVQPIMILVHHSLSASGMTLKANTWVPFLT